MKLEQLHFLVQTYHWGSMNKAANYCHVSHQLISRNLKELEQELDILLFKKDSGRINLTTEGEIVYENALKILKAEASITNSLKKVKDFSSIHEASDSMNLLFSVGLNYLVEPAIFNVVSKYPQLITLIHTKSLQLCREDLSSPQYEFILLQDSKEKLLSHSKYASHFTLDILQESKLFLYVGEQSPWASRKTVYLQEIESLPFVSYSADDNPLSTTSLILQENGITLNIKSSVNSFKTYCNLISNGAYVGIGCSDIVGNSQENLVTIPIKTSIVICIALFSNKAQIKKPCNTYFYNIFNDVYASSINKIY